MNRKYFIIAFELDRYNIFEVRYSIIGNNLKADFATSAEKFNRRKSDFKNYGQAQDECIGNNMLVRKFYEKWEKKHLKDLTDDEYVELLEDLEILKSKYNYIEEETTKYYNSFNFEDLVELSKRPIKKQNNT